jgi:hypothetical protein
MNEPNKPPTLAEVKDMIELLNRDDRARLRVHLLAAYEEDGSRHVRVYDMKPGRSVRG